MNPIYCRDVLNRPQIAHVNILRGEVTLSLLPNETSRLRPAEARWLAEALIDAADEVSETD